MCRLFALASPRTHPVTASFWLVDASDSLVVQSRREPDGTGLGWYAPAERSHVLRDPIPAWRDTRFLDQAARACSHRFIAHVRYASTGAVEEVNTHPFEQERRLFAHNGVVEGLDALRAHLGDDAARLVRGSTDSELTFALVTRETERAGGDVREGIRRAGAWIAEHLPVFAWNVILVDADALYALRYPDVHELWWLDRRAGGHREDGSSFRGRGVDSPLAIHSDDLAHTGSVVVASEPLNDDPGWTMLGSGELLSVDSDGVARRELLLADAPRHQLTLDDLPDDAATSQHSTPTSFARTSRTTRSSCES